jgi:hypothetical protein
MSKKIKTLSAVIILSAETNILETKFGPELEELGCSWVKNAGSTLGLLPFSRSNEQLGG